MRGADPRRIFGLVLLASRRVAVSNPIFVDVDGNGFKANGDTLGELPAKSQG
jgi:hypothetical protein